MEVQWIVLSIHLFQQLLHFNLFSCCTQSKLASMSNDFKSVLEVRTEVRDLRAFLAVLNMVNV